MRYDIHFYLHLHDPEVSAGLAMMAQKLDLIMTTLRQEMNIMTKEFDALQAEVQRSTDVDTSIETLVTGLAAQIQALKDDPVKLQALADQLRSNNDAIQSAVTANTPADTSVDAGATNNAGNPSGTGGTGSVPNA